MKNQKEINKLLLSHLTEIMEKFTVKEDEIKKLQECCRTLEAGRKLDDDQKSFLSQINAI